MGPIILNPKPDRNGVTVAVSQNDGIRSLIRTAPGFLIAETQNPQLNTSPAAVNDDGLTGDIAAGLRGQKEQRSDQLFGPAAPL